MSLVALPLASGAPLSEKALGVIGDSISVGSLSHPKLFWDVKEIESVLASKGKDGQWALNPSVEPRLADYSDAWQKIVKDEKGKIAAPKRLWEKLDEHKIPPLSKYVELPAREKYVGGYVDIEEYAWPYLVGRAMGLPASLIYLPAEAGNRSGDTARQARRLLKATEKVIPDLTFVFFTGNDLCGSDLGSDPKDRRGRYENAILSGVEELLRGGSPREDTTAKIVFVGHIAVDQLLTEKVILEKEIYAFGAHRSCQAFRKHDPGDEDIREKIEFALLRSAMTIFGHKNLPSPRQLCHSFMSLDKDTDGFEEGLKKLRGLVSAYQEGARALVERAEALAKKVAPKMSLSFHSLASPEKFRAEAEDMANDCFHLSPKGQQKLASAIWAELKEKKIIAK